MRVSSAFARAALILLVTAACAPEPKHHQDRCPPHAKLDALVLRDIGANAIDCGCVDENTITRRPAVRRCAAESFAAHRPFRARFDAQGLDSRVTEIMAGTADGRLITYIADGRAPVSTRSVCRTPRLSADRQQVYCADTN
jgi:hypothetical protein